MRIRPFRGYRYDPVKVRDLSRVVAPPYDQIDAETSEALHALHPWNFARVSLGRPEPGDVNEGDRHRRAREHLRQWIGDGVFVREREPALYPYLTTFRAAGQTVTRLGVVLLGELSEYAEGVVRPHERTHLGPRAERLAHLEATGADTGLIFMLASDASGELRRLVAPPSTSPLAEARDSRGELHQLWRISNSAAIARVQACLAEGRLIIADGHHRYETALEYRRRHPEAQLKLMAIFSLEASGLTIYATHRLLHDVPGFDIGAFVAQARGWFRIERVPALGDWEAEAVALTAVLDARRGRGDHAVAVVAGEEPAWLLTLLPEAAIPWPAGSSPAWRGLAVSVLHEGLLKPFARIAEEKLRDGGWLDYTAEAALAVALARKGTYQAGFLIPPTTVAELQAVVDAGEVLPQKSTYFYPKLLDGLVFVGLGDETAGGG